MLISLEKAGIVGRGDSRDMPITLMRAPERVTLRQLRDSLIPGERGVHFPEELCKLFGSLADNVEIEKVTLRDLVSSDA